MLRLMRRKVRLTDADPQTLSFFFEQYTAVMRDGKDATDRAMKDYLFDIITGLGVPDSIPLPETETEVIEAEPAYPVIVRRHGR